MNGTALAAHFWTTLLLKFPGCLGRGKHPWKSSCVFRLCIWTSNMKKWWHGFHHISLKCLLSILGRRTEILWPRSRWGSQWLCSREQFVSSSQDLLRFACTHIGRRSWIRLLNIRWPNLLRHCKLWLFLRTLLEKALWNYPVSTTSYRGRFGWTSWPADHRQVKQSSHH